jgi:DNA modification methylase
VRNKDLTKVDATDSIIQESREKRLLDDDPVHRWYRFVLAFPDHLVTEMCERFSATQGDMVLDPFCGTGTTLVECKKMGLDATGIEANPASVLASRVKTMWDIDPSQLRDVLQEIVDQVQPWCEQLTFSAQPLFADAFNADQLKTQLLAESPEGQYFVSSGMLKRGWISETPFYKTIALLSEIQSTECDSQVKKALKLALVAILVETVGNVSFGPEIYVSGRKEDVDVLGAFRGKVETMLCDLEAVQTLPAWGRSLVLPGDARECAQVLIENEVDCIDHVITSPPYPTEKDYTRQARLELVFLGFVHDRKSLRRVKRAMVRSHSKGIYKADDDGQWVADIPEVRAIADELREKIRDKTYGFAKLYPRIIEEYFGGMHRHLQSLKKVLRAEGQCAYVVGDQRTYLQTYTPTGKILGIIAERLGFVVEDVLVWRIRKGTTGSGEEIKEEIVILRKLQ